MSEENFDTEFLEESPNKKDNSFTGLFLLIMVSLFIIALLSLSPIFYLYNVDNVDYLYIGFSICLYTICILFGTFAGINGFVDVEHTGTMKKKNIKFKKALVIFLSVIPIISSFWFGVAIGNKTLSDLKKDYNSTSEILTPPPLDDYKPIVHKVSDYNFTSRSKILTPSADDILFHKRIEDDLLGVPRISKNLDVPLLSDAPLLPKSHKMKKSESEPQPINININLNINIPGIDVIEQKIPLEIDPSLNKDVEINVTKPVVEKSIRQLMNEQVIGHDNDRTNEDFHFEAIQNQIKNDLELKKNYILKKEMLEHELEDIKRKNESLKEIKQNVMPYLFQESKDNRFGDK